MNKINKYNGFRKQGFWKKELGQNLLINPRIINKIILAAEIAKNDLVIEVGPGTGNLTKKLAEKAGKVIAIEKDSRLIPSLKETFKDYSSVKIIEGDILKLNIETLIENYKLKIENSRYKVVANIPYYITSNLLRTIFEKWPRPELIVLTVQKEVAQRIMAKPPHMNLLALSVQYYSKPEIISYISKNNFRPVPKVDSAIIRLKPKHEARSTKHEKALFDLMRIGFSEKRKQLASVLLKKLKIDKNEIIKTFQKLGISPTARAENLSLEEWKNLGLYF
ncbi:MAG: ribosomal RNA small subunit methyltransferase A [Candidatus Yanofskybacteria bacterium RIFCSPHIGHO2_01_FULL_39_8b]|uniref:Ribosomal RNA small subunit methyltransferase A n=1 Tax=Candidatus Yanofskybacteria bacterium RIFCSPHIGHO2_01_FULL_39_8b TaxID=1802659 RepID=A0A1F8EE89_9BACT|nr:MAG: ribosomal RNA small subunit methyltransferase A [Candidatus Yanofskybacteria bacterium RIFCSPHIGHO2_01_FULL_39_8b]